MYFIIYPPPFLPSSTSSFLCLNRKLCEFQFEIDIRKSDKNCYFKCKCSGNCHFKQTLWPNLIKTITLNANARSGQGAKIECSNFTMIQVDIIQMDDYPTNSCAISPATFLLCFISWETVDVNPYYGYLYGIRKSSM